MRVRLGDPIREIGVLVPWQPGAQRPRKLSAERGGLTAAAEPSGNPSRLRGGQKWGRPIGTCVLQQKRGKPRRRQRLRAALERRRECKAAACGPCGQRPKLPRPLPMWSDATSSCEQWSAGQEFSLPRCVRPKERAGAMIWRCTVTPALTHKRSSAAGLEPSEKRRYQSRRCA